jgi:hypothetical protein
MLVQYRRDGRLRLFRQHDHALLAGELAASWTGIGRMPTELPFDLVLAAALHDLAWTELDERPEWDKEARCPVAFHAYPLKPKLAAYRDGLDRLERIHPYAALLASLHYTSFPEVSKVTALQEAEAGRHRKLKATLQLEPDQEARLARDLSYLKFFDILSILLCLTPPSASTDQQPEWVSTARHPETPDGGHLHVTWWDDDVVHVDPFPFRDSLEVRLPFRELPGDLDGPKALARAWAQASPGYWWLCIQQAPRLA